MAADENAALATAAQLRNRGWELRSQGLYGQARDSFSGAVDAASAVEAAGAVEAAKRALANALRGRSVIHDEMSNYGPAKLDLDRAFVLLDDLAACAGIERLREMCLTARGHSYLVQGSEYYNPALALEVYTDALAIAVRDQAGLVPAPDNVPQASRCAVLDPFIAKSNMASALSHLGRFEEAEALWNEVISNGALTQAMNSHLNWANACRFRGQRQQAADHWRGALILAKALGSMSHEASALANLAYYEQLDPALNDAGPGAAARHTELLELLQRMGRTPDQQCSICYDELDTHPQFESPYAPDAGLLTAFAPAVMDGCFHMYHIACIRENYEARARQGLAFVKCPMCGPGLR